MYVIFIRSYLFIRKFLFWKVRETHNLESRSKIAVRSQAGFLRGFYSGLRNSRPRRRVDPPARYRPRVPHLQAENKSLVSPGICTISRELSARSSASADECRMRRSRMPIGYHEWLIKRVAIDDQLGARVRASYVCVRFHGVN